MVLVISACSTAGQRDSQGASAAGKGFASKGENQGNSRYIIITNIMQKMEDGRLTLQVEMKNENRANRIAYYRTKWLDDSGFQVWDDEPWKSIMLHGDQVENIVITSPTTKAKDFRIQFNAEDNRSN